MFGAVANRMAGKVPEDGGIWFLGRRAIVDTPESSKGSLASVLPVTSVLAGRDLVARSLFPFKF